jgi:4-amino-4-deoxy-L-arabinose transferase-like glycosyltransferase
VKEVRDAAPAPRFQRRDLLILTLLGALLFLPGLGLRDVWNPDEARYAQVAREMRDAGSWAVPRLNGEVYTQKPPLLFWLIAASGLLTGGIGETASRLPSALSAIGAILLVYLIGVRFFGRRAGWLAAAAFATCFKILWQGRFGQIDMLLTALVTLGVWFWVRGYTEERPRLYLLFFACAGLATLAKGPVGLLPPLLSIVAFLAFTRNWAELRRLRIWLGLPVWAAVVLAWLVPAGLSGGEEYLRQIVFKQNVTRYVDPWHHFAPWYYYLTVIPAEFFPWSLLLPTALVVGWKRLVKGEAPPSSSPGLLESSRRSLDAFIGKRDRDGFLFCLCWMVVTVLFFSLSPAKRSVYVLTMYPAMALLVGMALDRIASMTAEGPRWRRWAVIPFAIVAAVFLLIVVALPVAGRDRPEAALLGGDPFVWGLTAIFVPAALGAILAFLSGWRSRPDALTRAAASLAVGLTVTTIGIALYALPRFDAFKSARGLSRELVSRMAPGDVYGIYPRIDSTFLFYTGRFCVSLDSEDRLRAFLARPGRIWLLAQRDDLGKLQGLPPLKEVARDADPREGYILFTRP